MAGELVGVFPFDIDKKGQSFVFDTEILRKKNFISFELEFDLEFTIKEGVLFSKKKSQENKFIYILNMNSINVAKDFLIKPTIFFAITNYNKSSLLEKLIKDK